MIRLCIALVLSVSAAIYGQETQAEATAARQVRLLIAGYISEFPFYVEWPEEVWEDHPDEIWIGLVGKDPLGPDGQQYLARRAYRQKQYVVKHLDKSTPLDQLKQFQIIYAGRTDPGELDALLKAVKGMPILTCGVAPHFLTSGGIVQFQVAGLAVSFNVQTENARAAGLKIDPLFITYGMIM